MKYLGDDQEGTWANLVPEQPKNRERWPIWLAIIAIVVVLACICAAGSFILAQEFLFNPGAAPDLAVPTLPGLELTATFESQVTTEPDTSSPTQPPIPTPEVIASPSLVVAPTATLPGATVEPIPVTGVVESVRLPVPPAIDGALVEWGDAPTYESAFLVYQVEGWDGSDDLAAVWRSAWDETNLYIGVEVIDDIHIQTQTGNQIFRGDSLDMQFDTDRNGDFGSQLSPDDFQITFSPGDFTALPPSAFRFQGTTGGQILDAPGGHHVNLQAQKTPGGYVLEAAIPWSDLNLTPVEGLIIGLSLNASDNDTPGPAVQEVMKSHVATRKFADPTSWGTLLLR